MTPSRRFEVVQERKWAREFRCPKCRVLSGEHCVRVGARRSSMAPLVHRERLAVSKGYTVEEKAFMRGAR